MADIQVINAVIDLGTNTFNLLIASSGGPGEFKVLHEERIGVKMGRGGIHREILLPEAMERGLSALSLHQESIRKFGATKVRVIGTSAIRGASNRQEFIDLVHAGFNWNLEVIDGDREAAYIFGGMVNSLPTLPGKYLVLDIGGGSNEFILAEGRQILWKKSLNIGIARVLELFTLSDPPHQQEITAVESWFSAHLEPLAEICRLHEPAILVGCSGAFDTLMDISEGKVPDTTMRQSTPFPLDEFRRIHGLLTTSSQAERTRIQGVDKNRVEMILVAVIFINFILEQFQFRQLIHTHFSLKEGVMYEMTAQ